MANGSRYYWKKIYSDIMFWQESVNDFSEIGGIMSFSIQGDFPIPDSSLAEVKEARDTLRGIWMSNREKIRILTDTVYYDLKNELVWGKSISDSVKKPLLRKNPGLVLIHYRYMGNTSDKHYRSALYKMVEAAEAGEVLSYG